MQRFTRRESRTTSGGLALSRSPYLSAVAVTVVVFGCGAPDDLVFRQAARGVQCGSFLEFEPINAYHGPRDWVGQREDSVALVNGDCTGVYLGEVGELRHVVITAGHCVAEEEEAVLAFNVETDVDGAQTTVTGFVVERADTPDYALIALTEDPEVSATVLGATFTGSLAAIQHPVGIPKVIAFGEFSHEDGGQLYYLDLDTLVGSSGSGLFNAFGRMVGLHTGGDCRNTGLNSGWSAAAVVEASRVLSNYVLARDF